MECFEISPSMGVLRGCCFHLMYAVCTVVRLVISPAQLMQNRISDSALAEIQPSCEVAAGAVSSATDRQ